MLFLFLSVFTFEGCSNLLDVDSNRLVFPDGYQMNASNDTLYSMFAIFSQLEKVADSYVILGELRGDLMDVTPSSNVYLKEINDFKISSNNPYANKLKDYYSVINNCNYVIHNIDTSVVKGGVKVMYKEYAACKAIRAWVYMQVVLNYGTAIYYEQPLLTIQDAEKVQKLTPLTITELAPILINDITPWKDVQISSLGMIYTHYMMDSFFRIRFLLGDLYLWTGQYENAANEYYDLMFKNQYLVNNFYTSTREVTNNAFTGNMTYSWLNSFSPSYTEQITSISSTNQYSKNFELDSLVINNMITPSAISIQNWDKQMYFNSNSLDTIGDLRKYGSVSIYPASMDLSNRSTATTKNYIYKLILMNPIRDKKETDKQIIPYRVTLLYLRYAEAVNRIGKPNLAMAVLKNGLNRANMNNKKIIPQHELGSSVPNYMNFNDVRFDVNIGVRMHGCGKVNLDTTYYIIPKLNALQDSVLYVENLIQQELALETAFEGNRFQDLMRMAIHRDDNAFLANLVSLKYGDNKAAIKTKLMDRANWYLAK